MIVVFLCALFGWSGQATALNPVVLSERGEVLQIDFGRLRGVEYLVAGQGPGLASRFGHAMLRITFCAVGQSFPCHADDFYAVDFGFAAQSDRLRFTLTGGITGRYPSLLFVNADTDLRARYLHDQFRDIRSYPLALTFEQRQAVVQALVNKFWIHKANYKFLSNNCADEVLKLLHEALPHSLSVNLYKSSSRDILTPNGLSRILQRQGFIRRGGREWKSDAALVESQLAEILPANIPTPIRITKYLSVPPNQRSRWFDRSLTTQQRMILARLERVSLKRHRDRINQAAVQALYAGEPLACSADRSELVKTLEASAAAINPRFYDERSRLIVPDAEQMPSATERSKWRKDLVTVIQNIVYCGREISAVKRGRVDSETTKANLRRILAR